MNHKLQLNIWRGYEANAFGKSLHIRQFQIPDMEIEDDDELKVSEFVGSNKSELGNHSCAEQTSSCGDCAESYWLTGDKVDYICDGNWYIVTGHALTRWMENPYVNWTQRCVLPTSRTSGVRRRDEAIRIRKLCLEDMVNCF